MTLRFIPSPPVPWDVAANWIVSPSPDEEEFGGVIIGDPTDTFLSTEEDEIVVMNVNDYMDTHDTVQRIIYHLEQDNIVYVSSQDNSSGIFVCCFLKHYFKMSDEDAVNDFNLQLTNRRPFTADSEGRGISVPAPKLERRIKSRAGRPKTYGTLIASQISFYKPPLVVLVTGDRDSNIEFEDVMTMELSDLHPDSIIVHGGCRGIDSLADRVAKKLHLEIRVYPAQWDVYGLPAGPIRNKLMLSENPDVVLAFHPDIQASKGTKSMMTLAYKHINLTTQRAPHIYLHSLKRKSQFLGDFTVL